MVYVDDNFSTIKIPLKEHLKEKIKITLNNLLNENTKDKMTVTISVEKVKVVDVVKDSHVKKTIDVFKVQVKNLDLNT